MLLLLSPLLLANTADEWRAWKVDHHKAYSAAEDNERFKLWRANAQDMEQRALGWEALGPFADMTPLEYVRRSGFGPRALAAMRSPLAITHPWTGIEPPASLDWREHNMVTPVKNQESCGSCWAFAAVATIEGQHAKASGSLTSLSEQNLVDCVKGETNATRHDQTKPCCFGCRGGWSDDALAYIVQHQSGHIATEAAYPYQGQTMEPQCLFNSTTPIGATIGGWVEVPSGNETALLDAVASVGPIGVSVDASLGWQLYHKGIIKPKLCSAKPSAATHAVTVVGYGTEDSTDYWIIKNSQGTKWGEAGYARLVRGKNACGIANWAVYPKGVPM
jgi:cathepsin L